MNAHGKIWDETRSEDGSKISAWGYNTIDLGLPQPNSPVYLLVRLFLASLCYITCTRGCPRRKMIGSSAGSLLLLGVEVLLQRHTELFPQGLELLQVLLVLALVLDLGLDACEGEELVNGR